MKSSRLLSSLAPSLILVCACAVSARAQERQAAAATPSPTPSGLALEFERQLWPTTYSSVPGGSVGGLGYRRLSPAQIPPGAPQPRAFSLNSVMEGDAVRVKVHLVMDRFQEQLILLGDYLLREGEQAVVEEMRQYGYEPLQFKVVRVKRASTKLPTWTSRVSAVEVARIEPRQSNFPSYRVTLRNISDKPIAYLEIETFQGSRPATTQWPRGELNRPLIKPGETYEIIASGGIGSKSEDAYEPASIDRIEIISAVFNDKSYEGDAASANNFFDMMLGRRIQLERVLPLLASASAQESADESASLEDLERCTTALSRAWRDIAQEIPAEHPSRQRPDYLPLQSLIEGGLDHVRRELLTDIREYREARARAAVSEPYGKWLSRVRRKYEAWRARL